MPAYIIATYDVVDPEKYQDYLAGVTPLLVRHGAEVLVAETAATNLEGEPRGVYVVLRFESDEAARAWYNDPAYEPVRKIRLDASANGNMVLASSFVPPAD